MNEDVLVGEENYGREGMVRPRGWDSSIALQCPSITQKLRTSFGSKKRARVMTATMPNKNHLFCTSSRKDFISTKF